jgi:type VI secretion system protein ImpJ
MSLISKPLWTEGLRVRPQHFQQQDRWIEHLIEGRVAGVRHCNWGLRALTLDKELLPLGKIGIKSLTAVLPDGTVIDLPAQGPLPEPRSAPTTLRNALVKIAVPLRMRDGAETSNDPATVRRFEGIDQSARDSTSPERPAATVRVGRLNVQILFEGEKEDDLTTMPIARVREVEPTGAVSLAQGFVPPCLDFHVAERLVDIVNETRSLLKSRADAIAARSDSSRMAAESAGLADLLTIAIINGQEALLDHFASVRGVHPVEIFQTLLQLTAQLATFSSGRRKPADLPVYRHDDIEASVAPLLERLREFLTVVIERNAVPLELQQRGYGIVTSIIADRSLFQDSRFVLTAVANVPAETLRSQLPTQMKVGSVEQIRDLVNLQLPGIPLRALPVAPPELPFLQNGVYFELDQSVELWRNLARSAAFAMHLSGEYPDLHLEFWAIRKKRA